MKSALNIANRNTNLPVALNSFFFPTRPGAAPGWPAEAGQTYPVVNSGRFRDLPVGFKKSKQAGRQGAWQPAEGNKSLTAILKMPADLSGSGAQVDTIYYQENDAQGPEFWVNEPFEGTEGKMRLNGLRGQPNTRTGVERRRHKRFRVEVCAFALVRSANSSPLKIPGRGMGEIACAVFRSRPAKLGQIDNVSRGGLMFHYVASAVRSKQATVLDILLADCKFYLENLRFRPISDLLLPDEFSDDSMPMGRLQVEFERLSSCQIAKLEYFVREIRSRSKRTFNLDPFGRSRRAR